MAKKVGPDNRRSKNRGYQDFILNSATLVKQLMVISYDGKTDIKKYQETRGFFCDLRKCVAFVFHKKTKNKHEGYRHEENATMFSRFN